MRKDRRSIFWIEAVLGTCAALLAVLTAVWPDWAERIFSFDPDIHSGAFEWALVVGLFLAAILFSGMAFRDWRNAARTVKEPRISDCMQ